MIGSQMPVFHLRNVGDLLRNIAGRKLAPFSISLSDQQPLARPSPLVFEEVPAFNVQNLLFLRGYTLSLHLAIGPSQSTNDYTVKIFSSCICAYR
jgi:hypothetical protein